MDSSDTPNETGESRETQRDQVQPVFSLKALNSKEREILTHFKLGLSNKEIGQNMGIHPNVVKGHHMCRIYKKLKIDASTNSKKRPKLLKLLFDNQTI